MASYHHGLSSFIHYPEISDARRTERGMAILLTDVVNVELEVEEEQSEVTSSATSEAWWHPSK